MKCSLSTATIAVLFLLAAAALMAGCSQQEPMTVKLSDHPTYGTILTDSTGRSLYVQAKDIPNTGAVANLGEVGHFYPPFYAETVANERGINVSEFGYLTRADGQRQTTYRGWPLYYYLNDKEPGDAKSQGANNITFLAKPDYTVMVRENSTVGVYLTDTAGAALYAPNGNLTSDVPPDYLPFKAPAILGPSPLVQPGDFGQTSDGRQTTYHGRPLFMSSEGGGTAVLAGDGDGFAPVILAATASLSSPAGTPTGPSTPIATPTEPVGATTPAASVATTVGAATATTRPAYDPYTGGSYTPTPTPTAQIISRATESATPTETWTPVGTTTVPVTTAAPVTSIPTTTFPPLTLPPTTTTVAPVLTPTPTASLVSTTTVSPATTTMTATTTRIPTTAPTSTPPTTATQTVTSLPTVLPTTTVPTTLATTLPLPFPVTTTLPAIPPLPAVSETGETGSG